MKRFIRNLTVLLFFVFSKSYIAQQYSFYNYKEQNGLSKNTVLSIAQMPNGEIWLGTNDGGINILDGMEIRVLDKNKGLVDNVVYDIVPLQNGQTLIATNNGINLLQKDGRLIAPEFDSLVAKRVFTALELSDSSVLLATGKGLALLRDGEVETLKTESDLLNGSPVIHVGLGKNGEVWCSTMGSSVFRLSRRLDSIEQIVYKDNLEFTFSTFLFHDSIVWILSYQGLYELRGGSVSLVERAEHRYYHYAFQDTKRNVWVATNQGLIKYTHEGKRLFFTPKNRLAGVEAWKVFEDREGNIWVTFKKEGVSKLVTEAFVLHGKEAGIKDENVESIYIDKDKTKWLGTSNGVVHFLGGDSVEYYKINYSSKDQVKAIDRLEDELYCLSADGVNVLDKAGNYENIDSKSGNRFVGQCIYIDKGRVFLGASILGVAEFKNGEIVYLNDSLGFPEKTTVFDIIKTKDGLWWYATEEGLYIHNGKELKKIGKESGLPIIKTRCLVTDKKGRLWVGNSEGAFFREGEKFYAVYEKDTTSNNSVYSLAFDNNDILWIGKIDGLDRVSLKGNEVVQIKHYDAKRGCEVGSLHNNAIAVTDDNHLWLGTDRGLMEYNPEEDYPNTVESATHITGIRLFSQPTDWRDYCDSVNEYGFPVGLELSYNQNYFTFDYIGICHRYPQGVEYMCKLEGLDKEWVHKGTKRSAIYGNLPPGKYTFMVKSCNNEGVWNRKPQTFSFVILPPFWKTWWFYGLCLSIIMAGIYSYLKIRSANIQISKKNKVIEEKNTEIMDSINYAKRIQDAMLPDSKIDALIPDNFVFFRPKDVVSGDFYWVKRSGSKILFAVVDCTGHGVPGAFVSMIGFSGLNRAVNEYKLEQPSDILEKLSDFVVESFAKHHEKSINDGMDAALCSIDFESKVLEFSGANNSLYIVRKTENPLLDSEGNPVSVKELGVLKEVKATRRPIGKSDRVVPFVNYKIQLEKGDTVYLFSDGFPDQFGGERGKKYMYKAFKRFLISIQKYPIKKQRELLKKEFENWVGEEHEQVDDVCVLGIRL